VLDVIITAATGQKYTASSNFTVANAASANPMHIYVDTPTPSSSLTTSLLTVSGWALDNLSAISNVSLAIDGTFIQNATYNLLRADVCAAYPGRIGCPYVGWT